MPQKEPTTSYPPIEEHNFNANIRFSPVFEIGYENNYAPLYPVGKARRRFFQHLKESNPAIAKAKSTWHHEMNKLFLFYFQQVAEGREGENLQVAYETFFMNQTNAKTVKSHMERLQAFGIIEGWQETQYQHAYGVESCFLLTLNLALPFFQYPEIVWFCDHIRNNQQIATLKTTYGTSEFWERFFKRQQPDFSQEEGRVSN